MIERISAWVKKPRKGVWLRNRQMRVAKSSQCQGSAVSINATTWPHEPSDRFHFKRIVNNPQEKCACWARATRFAMHSSCTATTRRPGHIRNSYLERPQNLETKFNLFPDGILAKDSRAMATLCDLQSPQPHPGPDNWLQSCNKIYKPSPFVPGSSFVEGQHFSFAPTFWHWK